MAHADLGFGGVLLVIQCRGATVGRSTVDPPMRRVHRVAAYIRSVSTNQCVFEPRFDMF